MSRAATVEAYLAELPPERREVIEQVRALVNRHLPVGYREAMNWGMITYEIPLERYPRTYNGQPACYASLAAQKNHYALYLMTLYDGTDSVTRFAEAFTRAGKKLDMGKSCVRFRRIDDLALDAIAGVIAATTPEQYIERMEAMRAARGAASRSTAGQPVARKTAKGAKKKRATARRSVTMKKATKRPGTKRARSKRGGTNR